MAKADDSNMEEKILLAAETMFMKQGLAKTTTAQIAKEAGCNQALVHYYYRTKDNLFNKIFSLKVNMVMSNITDLLGSTQTGSFIDKISVVIDEHFKFINANSHLVPFLIVEFITNPERIAQCMKLVSSNREKMFDAIKNELEREIAAGNIEDISFLDLLQDIIYLDISTFLFKDSFQTMFRTNNESMDVMINHRKEEIKKLIIARLTKKIDNSN